MSEIFSFRLNKTNLREARAMEILQEKTIEGISLRQVITDGLLTLASRPSEANISGGETIHSMLNLILEMLKQDNQKYQSFENRVNEESEMNILSVQFTNCLRRDAKKGLKL
jgi:hypothetical protein